MTEKKIGKYKYSQFSLYACLCVHTVHRSATTIKQTLHVMCVYASLCLASQNTKTATRRETWEKPFKIQISPNLP